MDKHKQRITLTAAAVLVPLMAACGTEKAGSGSVGTEELTGVVWSFDSVTADGTTHRSPADAHITFREDGRAEGSYGCNTFSARTTAEDGRIRLTDATSTDMACDKKPMDFEHVLAAALTGSGLTTGRTGDRLTLTKDNGDTVRLSESPDAPLRGTKWNVTVPDARGEAHLTLDARKNTLTGRLGCNRVHAGATVRDGRITLGTPTTTRMMCEDSLMDTERALLRALKGPVTYRIDHRTLTLTSENGSSVRAVADR